MTRPLEATEVIRKAEIAFLSFSKSMEVNVKELETQIDRGNGALASLEVRTNDVGQNLEHFTTEASSKIAGWQAHFSNDQTNRAEEHSTAQIDRETRFNQLLSEWTETAQTQANEIQAKHSDELKSVLSSFEERGKIAMQDVDEKHQSVLEIHKLVGRDSVAGGYQTSAGHEKAAADRWRNISMVALLTTIFWLCFKYWIGFEQSTSGEINWPDVLTAASLTAILLLTAGYTSKQSKMHRENEKQMRSFALETKALDPFMASLGPNEQSEIKAELIRRMFGQQHARQSEKSKRTDDDTIKTFVEKLSDSLTKKLGS